MQLKTYFAHGMEYIKSEEWEGFRKQLVSAIANTQPTPEAWGTLSSKWSQDLDGGDRVYIEYARAHWDELVAYMVKQRLK